MRSLESRKPLNMRVTQNNKKNADMLLSRELQQFHQSNEYYS